MDISIDNQQSKRVGKNNEVNLCSLLIFYAVVAGPEFAPALSLVIKVPHNSFQNQALEKHVSVC